MWRRVPQSSGVASLLQCHTMMVIYLKCQSGPLICGVAMHVNVCQGFKTRDLDPDSTRPMQKKKDLDGVNAETWESHIFFNNLKNKSITYKI